MSLANKVNRKGGTVAEGIDTKKLEYVKAKEILFEDGDPIVLKGFFFQNGKYGKSVTLVTDKLGINVPERYVKMFESFEPEERASKKKSPPKSAANPVRIPKVIPVTLRPVLV